MQKSIAATVERLRFVLKNEPVLWVGAGASIRAGYPSTNHLVEKMRHEVAIEDGPIAQDHTFEQVADVYVDTYGDGALGDLLQNEIGPPRTPTGVHQCIARLVKKGNIATIITTNYDDVLERALADAGVHVVVQAKAHNEGVVGGDVRLIKLHGTHSDWMDVVLSGRSYAYFDQRYGFVLSQLNILLRQHWVLFVGCSMQDPRILQWLKEMSSETQRAIKPWRVLMTKKEWESTMRARWSGGDVKDSLARAKIRALILRDHDHLDELFGYDVLSPGRNPPSSHDPKSSTSSIHHMGEGQWLVENKPITDRFDVFLCHNSEDKSEVKKIGSQLKENGLRPWLDIWELRPGIPWQPLLEQHIDKIDAAVVFLGPSGIGPWQQMELDAYLRQFVKRSCPVIPVILPGVSKVPNLPVFLDALTRVDFRQNEPDPLERLIWGITGEKQGSRVTHLSPYQNHSRNPDADYLMLPDTKPFHLYGTMPYGHPAYVKRASDRKLLQAVQEDHVFIAVEGPNQIGKSSLLKQYPSWLGGEWTVIEPVFEFLPISGANQQTWDKKFFRWLRKEIKNDQLDDWLALESALDTTKFGFLLDEFPSVGAKIFHLLVRRLYELGCTHRGRVHVIAAFPGDMKDYMTKIGREAGNTNPKYVDCWHKIRLEPFTTAEAEQLFRTGFPDPVPALLKARLSEIEIRTEMLPHRLQVICSDIWTQLGASPIPIDELEDRLGACISRRNG